MDRPFFSVIIPTLNEEHYVPLLLTDLTQQTEAIFEVIIVDANSEDATVKRVKDFAKKLPIQILHSKKRNVAFQKNLGASVAKGQHLIFIDADASVKKTFIANLHAFLIKNPSKILLSKNTPLEGTLIEEVLFTFINLYIQMSQYIGQPNITAGCLVFEKPFFHEIGEFDEKLMERSGIGEDHEIIIRSKRKGIRATYTNESEFRFSLRRLHKEGHLTVMTKYLTSGSALKSTGTIDHKLFEYEMGGHVYEPKTRKK